AVRRIDRGQHPGSKPRGLRLYCLRSEGESGVLVGVCKRCAVTLAALGSQSRSSTAPSRPDAPTKLNLVAPGFYPPDRAPTLGGAWLSTSSVSAAQASRSWAISASTTSCR